MFQDNNSVIEIKQEYQAGKRNFQNIQLRRIDLRGLDLSYADFRGADISYANLIDVNLSGANLQEAYLNESDLSGSNLKEANLNKASLIRTYLIKTNFEKANFKEAYLIGSKATKANFKEANFDGAYLKGLQLTGANLQDSSYTNETHFDGNFDPEKAGMKKVELLKIEPVCHKSNITVRQLLDTFNHLYQISHRYLGKTMTVKYWEASRHDHEWLKQFEINHLGQISFTGEPELTLSPLQLEIFQEWVKRFIKSCSAIMQNFPNMIDQQQIVFDIFPTPPNNKVSSYEIKTDSAKPQSFTL
ncbi:pentapeptide repeat-containing protein [Aphanothece sacrum]|uniref:Pentapeptide repeat protein n=1 Tax=Aphanothece sacrum FPU1 TaxID=1920663 RepID=A0A401IKE1_APHSA|nr:pentapeptide repeat-containing protein [Aphanothece sacrum]GBF81640.1 pentapeptide repeat protein [Aphanothece sacrum FPU1]GBF84101.1 pentapeptide repeat protein [Aphanothece sacrum FPU3]